MAQGRSGSIAEAEDTTAVSSCRAALVPRAACSHQFVLHHAPRPPTRRSPCRRIFIHRRGVGLTEESRYALFGVLRHAFIRCLTPAGAPHQPGAFDRTRRYLVSDSPQRFAPDSVPDRSRDCRDYCLMELLSAVIVPIVFFGLFWSQRREPKIREVVPLIVELP
jgi:hypothetical protein